MIGLVIVTHGNLACEFKMALEHVVGEQKQLEAVAILADDDMEKKREDIRCATKNVDSGMGAIILTDMFGGTPSNLAISIMEEEKIEVIAGINLPLLIKLNSLREKENMEVVIEKAMEAGKQYINIAREVIATK